MTIKKICLFFSSTILLIALFPGILPIPFTTLTAQTQLPETCMERYQGSMVGYWNFDEISDPMRPVIGSMRGTIIGTVSTGSGIAGKALEFSGNGYVNYGTELDIPAWDSYTVSIWFLNDGRVPPAVSYGQKIIDKTTWFSDFFIGVPNNPNPVVPRPVVFMYDRDFKNIQTTGYDYIDSQWHHALITKAGTDGELWIDGILIGAKDNVNPTINNQPLLMGYSLSGDGYQRLPWGGYLDEFAVFDRALSATEIFDLYQRSQNGEAYCAADGDVYPPGKLVFMDSDDFGQQFIFTINPDGTERTQLTFQGVSTSPTWSPDGSLIAFSSNMHGGAPEIYLMNADGSAQRQLTSTGGSMADWSPDGERLVYIASNEIYTIRTDGTEQTRLTANNALDWMPVWSPRVYKIVFATNRDGNMELYEMNPDGLVAKRLTNNGESDLYPDIAPDGLSILLTRGVEDSQELYVTSTSGGTGTRLTNNNVADYAPAWSPDGTKITYTSWGGEQAIYVMDADGSNPRRVTTGQASDWQPSPATFVVNTTAFYGTNGCDSHECTFTEAVTAASKNSGPSTIAFNIPGPGPHTIQFPSSMTIEGPLVIDGYTQPGSQPSTTTDPAYLDAKPRILFDGSQLPKVQASEFGLNLCRMGHVCTIQGIVFHSFPYKALRTGVYTLTTGNFFGTDETGTLLLPNQYSISGGGGLIVGNLFGGNALLDVGGVTPLIQGNRFGVGLDGTPLPGSYGVYYTMQTPGTRPTVIDNLFENMGVSVSMPGGYIARNTVTNSAGGPGCQGFQRSACVVEDNIITNNFGRGIGVPLTAGTAVRRNIVTDNGTHGIVVDGRDKWSLDPDPHLIIEENLITRNGGVGILHFGRYSSYGYEDNTFATIRNNSIYNNGEIGIDLSATDFFTDGVTLNDPGDLDLRPNHLQNFPVLERAGGNPTATVIQGQLNTTPNGTFTIDFYANTECDPSGYGEGERYLGNAVVTTDAAGNAYFSQSIVASTAILESLTATATTHDGATSEFSQCVLNTGITNDYLAQEGATVDASRLGEGLFVIHATFRNASDVTLNNGFFKVAKLAYPSGELEPAELVVRNAIGAPQGTGALVAMPDAVAPDATFVMTFEINLPRIETFNFFVDAYGLPSSAIVAAIQQGTTMPPFELTIREHSLAEIAAKTIYLPLINR